jgi:hypothetical protein
LNPAKAQRQETNIFYKGKALCRAESKRKEKKMKAISMHKRAIAIALATLMIAAVTTVSVFAYAPTPPYFYSNSAFTATPPMGNATVFDVELYDDGTKDWTLLFLQPERYYETHIMHDFVGAIDYFTVIDGNGGVHDVLIPGNIAQIDTAWQQLNIDGDPYYEIVIGVQLFDVTDNQFSTHQRYTVYYKI